MPAMFWSSPVEWVTERMLRKKVKKKEREKNSPPEKHRGVENDQNWRAIFKSNWPSTVLMIYSALREPVEERETRCPYAH